MKIVALAGGVGGAKLVYGLSQVASLSGLTVIVNTGDDFEHFGLWISPDLDTVCYTLAGIENPEYGWGRADESWVTFEEIKYLGGPSWFNLGNKDLGLHLERTRRLKEGDSLSKITTDFCDTWGIKTKVMPMSDDPIPTQVLTNQGTLDFQDYFVRLSCEPAVKGFQYQVTDNTKPATDVLKELKGADLVIICPSNPWVSIEPILAVPGIRKVIQNQKVLAVSPIISGKAVKGPAAKMYQELGISPSASAIAKHYGNLLDGIVIDTEDCQETKGIIQQTESSIKVYCTDILMKTKDDRIRLGSEVVEFGQQLMMEN